MKVEFSTAKELEMLAKMVSQLAAEAAAEENKPACGIIDAAEHKIVSKQVQETTLPNNDCKAPLKETNPIVDYAEESRADKKKLSEKVIAEEYKSEADRAEEESKKYEAKMAAAEKEAAEKAIADAYRAEADRAEEEAEKYEAKMAAAKKAKTSESASSDDDGWGYYDPDGCEFNSWGYGVNFADDPKGKIIEMSKHMPKNGLRQYMIDTVKKAGGRSLQHIPEKYIVWVAKQFYLGLDDCRTVCPTLSFYVCDVRKQGKDGVINEDKFLPII